MRTTFVSLLKVASIDGLMLSLAAYAVVNLFLVLIITEFVLYGRAQVRVGKNHDFDEKIEIIRFF